MYLSWYLTVCNTSFTECVSTNGYYIVLGININIIFDFGQILDKFKDSYNYHIYNFHIYNYHKEVYNHFAFYVRFGEELFLRKNNLITDCDHD